MSAAGGAQRDHEDPEVPQLSVSAAARLLGVSASSLRAWAAEGKIPHRRTTGGHRRFLRSDLERWLEEHGGALPEPPARAPELIAARTFPSEALAALLRARASEILEATDSPDAPGGGPLRRRRARRRMGRLGAQLEAVASGVALGDLGRCLREAEWVGFRAGAGPPAGDGPVADTLRLRWAVDRAVGPALAGRPEELRSLQRTMDRLVIRVAAGLADGILARRRSA